jgi:hypothetical protein
VKLIVLFDTIKIVEKQIFRLPPWLIALYAFSAVILIPWTYNLAKNLPTYHLAHHWDIAWVGVDTSMTILLACTAYLAAKRSIWQALTATSLATLLVLDAWFDVLTSSPGHDQIIALGFAAFIELPLALLTYLMAHGAIYHLHKEIQYLKDPLTKLVSMPHDHQHHAEKRSKIASD